MSAFCFDIHQHEMKSATQLEYLVSTQLTGFRDDCKILINDFSRESTQGILIALSLRTRAKLPYNKT